MITQSETVKMSSSVQAPSRISLIERLSMSLMGVPQRHQVVLSDTAAASTLRFQATALVASSVVFAVTSTLFSHSLIGSKLPLALLTGLAAGAALFILDHQTLLDLRLNPQGGRGVAWAIRLVTILMALMMSLLGGVVSHKQDIDRLRQAAVKKTVALTLQSNPSFKAVASSLALATKYATRKAWVEAELGKIKFEMANFEGELTRELGGAYDPTTNGQRAVGDGPRALHWRAARDAAKSKTAVLEAELLSLGDVQKRQSDLRSALTVLEQQATTNATLLEQGPAKELEFLFRLLTTEWTTWLSLCYGAGLALLPELLLLKAFARSTSLEYVYSILNEVEKQRANALALMVATQVKNDLASLSRPVTVRLNTPPQRGKVVTTTSSKRSSMIASL